MPQDPYRVQVCFSGLILFVRNSTTKRITHVLLRKTGRDEHAHDPFFCNSGGMLGCPPQDPTCRLDRVRLTFGWLDQNDDPIERSGTPGAGPSGWPNEITELPLSGNRNNFYWTPRLRAMGVSSPVDPACYADPGGGTAIPSRVAAQVLLEEGAIRTGDFAFCEDDKGTRWVPMLGFRKQGGSTMREQAGSEKVIWELTAPREAKYVAAYSQNLDQAGTPQRIAKFEAIPDAVLKLTISNNPPPRIVNGPHPNRMPGRPGEHFAMLFDFLKDPPSTRPIPWIPDSYRPQDIGDSGPRKNVVPYEEGATEFQDCHELKESGEGTAARPLCVPAVGDG